MYAHSQTGKNKRIMRLCTRFISRTSLRLRLVCAEACDAGCSSTLKEVMYLRSYREWMAFGVELID